MAAVETKVVTEIPISREQVTRLKIVGEDLRAQHSAMEKSSIRSRGSDTVLGWHYVNLGLSAEFFEAIAQDLSSGKPIEVTASFERRGNERILHSLYYQTSVGPKHCSEGILEENALYQTLFQDGNDSSKWSPVEQRIDMREELQKGHSVYLTPRDLIASYS